MYIEYKVCCVGCVVMRIKFLSLMCQKHHFKILSEYSQTVSYFLFPDTQPDGQAGPDRPPHGRHHREDHQGHRPVQIPPQVMSEEAHLRIESYCCLAACLEEVLEWECGICDVFSVRGWDTTITVTVQCKATSARVYCNLSIWP